MNKVILMGRLTSDPEIKGSTNGNIARYTLAVDRGIRRDAMNQDRQTPEQTADFFRCVAFDKGAEFAQKYLTKGTKILIEGKLRTGSYTNRDGQKVSTTDVVVDRHEFAEGKKAAEPKPQQGDDWMSVDDPGLPFN